MTLENYCSMFVTQNKIHLLILYLNSARIEGEIFHLIKKKNISHYNYSVLLSPEPKFTIIPEIKDLD